MECADHTGLGLELELAAQQARQTFAQSQA